jgi:hypothetical protein
VKIEEPDKLKDLLHQNQSNVSLYELQMENGPNRTAEALDGIANVNRLTAIKSCEATLKDLFFAWAGGGSGEYEIRFDKVNAKDAPPTAIACKSTIDISPLRANQEIAKLRDLGATDKSKDAVEIAKQYRVVTPVSGAVGLETDKDYKRFGLSTSQSGSNNSPSTHAGHAPGLKELMANSFNVGDSDKALTAQKAEFEQRSAPIPSAQPHSTSEANSELNASDDTVDVQAVPEPDNWIFLLTIGIFLYQFRKKILLAISK